MARLTEWSDARPSLWQAVDLRRASSWWPGKKAMISLRQALAPAHRLRLSHRPWPVVHLVCPR